MQLKWLVMKKMTDSSIHRGEGPRQGLGTGLPGWIGVPAVPGGDMAPPAAVAGSEANAIGVGLRSTGVGTLEKRPKKKQHEGQMLQIKGIFPQSLIHHSAPRMAAQMSEHH